MLRKGYSESDGKRQRYLLLDWEGGQVDFGRCMLGRLVTVRKLMFKDEL